MSTDEAFRALVRNRLHEVMGRIAAAATKVGRNPADVTLVAVTKSLPLEKIPFLNGLGMNHFGENRPQELCRRQPLVPEGSWHLIGHLQRNKVAQSLPHTFLFHTMDSLRLLQELEKEAGKSQKAVQALIQVNGSREPQKGGFSPEEVPGLVPVLSELKWVRVHGLMTMAADTDDPETTRPTFALVRGILNDLKACLHQTNHPLNQLSMGMSGDYEVAVEEGATLVRVGSALFGAPQR